jgi:hypothetical protein
MAKVTPLRAGISGKDFGEFHIEKFSMFEEDELEDYAALRNKAADAANGIKVELMREYSRKSTTVQGSGESQVVTTTEEIILVVHYWQKPPARHKGDTDEDLQNEKSALSP